MNGPKIYFEIPILGGIPITQTAVSSFVVMVSLCTAGFFLGRNLKKRPGNTQTVVEKLVSMLYSLVEETMGKHNSYWTPYIGALFLSSVCGSLIGMTGVLKSATADLSTTITWALMTSVLVWGCTIKTNGFKSWIIGYMNPLNIVSDIAQPISMAFRHFGNIMGGGVLMSLLYSALAAGSALVIGLLRTSGFAFPVIFTVLGAVIFIALGLKRKKFLWKVIGTAVFLIGLSALAECLGLFSQIPILSLGIPGVLSLYFDVFSGGVQALVFSLLTMVYVGSACPPPEEKGN